jgi:large subunit ribosomal protein L28
MSLSLFGRYIRQQGKLRQGTFRKYQITKLVPNCAAGRTPSAASQRGLFHSDDFNSYWKISAFNTMYRKRIAPYAEPKKFNISGIGKSGKLRTTASALYAIDDKGGIDNYVDRTPPEELRSATAERIRTLSVFHQTNPEVSHWSLPWPLLRKKRDRMDPSFARYKFLLRRGHQHNSSHYIHGAYSPYFLPENLNQLNPERTVFVDRKAPELNLWWKSDPTLEHAFRKRLKDAKSFEEAFADREIPGGYRKGEGAGGGGGQGSPRPRSKTYRSRQSRPF